MDHKEKSVFASISEAVENLSTIKQIDLDNPPLIGVVEDRRFVIDTEENGGQSAIWLSGEGSETICSILDSTFQSVQYYLKTLLNDPGTNWDDPTVIRETEMLIVLCGDAAAKMDQYLQIRLGKALRKKIEERQAYKSLHDFYHNELVKKIENRERFNSDGKSVIKFDEVRQDLNYELFLISDENGTPYFTFDLLKNIRLVCFDGGIDSASFEEDPLLKVRALEDRNLQAAAQQILTACNHTIHEFYALSRNLGMELINNLRTAIMALYLTANPKNLIQNAAEKSSLSYFQDFHLFLRKAMNSDEYLNLIAYPPEKKDKVPFCLLSLVHELCHALFFRSSGAKQETIGLLHRIMRKGENKLPKRGVTIWDQFLIDDEHFRSYLNQFPNGSLFKVLDTVREEDKQLSGFDPFLQGNLPERLCELFLFDQKVNLIKMACPTQQFLINKATIIEEFRGFLRANAPEKKKHLLINLQERLSWQESTRSAAIEELQQSAEFKEMLVVVSFTKNSSFYFQNENYTENNSYIDFIQKLKNQITNPELNGFFFPPIFFKSIYQWIDHSFSFIHQVFFQEKSVLEKQEREDFIEIVYLFLILKMIVMTNPDSISFCCKDAVDVGAAQTALFYGFYALYLEELGEHTDFLRYLFYAPALIVRERAIHTDRFMRTLSALQRIDQGISSRKKEFYSRFLALFKE